MDIFFYKNDLPQAAGHHIRLFTSKNSWFLADVVLTTDRLTREKNVIKKIADRVWQENKKALISFWSILMLFYDSSIPRRRYSICKQTLPLPKKKLRWLSNKSYFAFWFLLKKARCLFWQKKKLRRFWRQHTPGGFWADFSRSDRIRKLMKIVLLAELSKSRL